MLSLSTGIRILRSALHYCRSVQKAVQHSEEPGLPVGRGAVQEPRLRVAVPLGAGVARARARHTPHRPAAGPEEPAAEERGGEPGPHAGHLRAGGGVSAAPGGAGEHAGQQSAGHGRRDGPAAAAGRAGAGGHQHPEGDQIPHRHMER